MSALAAKYAYVRVSAWVNVAGKVTECVGGLELLDNEQCNIMYGNLSMLMNDTFMRVEFPDDLAVARAFEARVCRVWPGRSYFCEVGADDRYVQIFEPKHLVDPT